MFGEEHSAPVMDSGVELAVGASKSQFLDLQRQILETDTQLNQIELQFYSAVNSKAIELEGISGGHEKEIDKHRHLFEILELSKLEKRLRQFEKSKIKLLQRELRFTSSLKHKSRVHGFKLDELEAMYDAEARRRELTITKLYARLNHTIHRQVFSAEGSLRTISRKRTFNDKKEEMLFDGIRDQKLRANWYKTP